MNKLREQFEKESGYTHSYIDDLLCYRNEKGEIIWKRSYFEKYSEWLEKKIENV